ncbi:NAD-dependent deacylase [bacterium CPR1]|nr:NAD-dependent deacylase [bacterium CPR1]
MLGSARRIVVLTGAGISVASGLRPFRGPGGVWTDNPEAERESAAPDLPQHPERIWKLFGPMRREVVQARPNAAHLALARLEERSEVTLVTQNVDGLHLAAGSRNLLELHGSLLRSRCSACELPAFEDPHGEMRPCPACGALLRPDIVLFGEELPYLVSRAAFRACWDCDLFLAVGTSGNVAPASRLVREAQANGARTALVNLEPLEPPNPFFDQEFLGRAEELLPRLLEGAR